MPISFLTKSSKKYDGEKKAYSTNVAACEKLKQDRCLSSCTSINSKWIKDLNIRPENLKLVQERTRNTLEAIGIGKDFLNRTPAAQQLRERMSK
jgi:hypothetical protein